MHDHIRIESVGLVATDVKVFYVPGDGREEVEISNCVNGITFEPFGVGDVIAASLRVFVGKATVNAKVEDVIVNHLKPPKRRRPWHRVRDVTRFADRFRQVELS